MEENLKRAALQIAEEMYGTTLRAKILILSSAPPENKLKYCKIVPWLCWNNAATCSGLIPGIGICVPNYK